MAYSGYDASHLPTTSSNTVHYQMGSRPRPLPPIPSSVNSNVVQDEVEFVRIQPKEVISIDITNKNTLHRALNANQVTTIVLGGTLGTGLLMGTGPSLYQGGPLGLLLAYLFVCGLCYCTMTSLCEMTTYLPHKKGFVGYVSKYVHPAIGFALGWTYLCQFLFVPAAMISSAALVVGFIGSSIDQNGGPIGNESFVSPGVWTLIFILIVIGINLLGIRGFGHLEFWLSTFKVFALVAIIIFGLVIDLGGVPLKAGGYDRLGFIFWRPPHGPFSHTQGGETLGSFLGFYDCMVRALLSLVGIELLGVAVGEIANPRVSAPKAFRQTYGLVFTLYILGIIVVGLICSSNDASFRIDHSYTSPFLVAANRVAVNGAVPIICAVIVVFALSCAISNVYAGSRILYGLALDRQAPFVLRKVTVGGRPLVALGIFSAGTFLSYVSGGGLNYLFSMVNAAGPITWMCILWAHIRFRHALHAQGYPINRETLRYISPTHPYGTWFALVAIAIIIIFRGYNGYKVKSRIGDALITYFFVPWFLCLFLGWKYWHKEGFTLLSRIDLQEGKREIDLEEDEWYRRKGTKPPQP